MTGLIKRNGQTYIFRNDHAHKKSFWAWNIKDDYSRATVHKWNKLPEGEVELFDIENPPQTVSYQPLLD